MRVGPHSQIWGRMISVKRCCIECCVPSLEIDYSDCIRGSAAQQRLFGSGDLGRTAPGLWLPAIRQNRPRPIGLNRPSEVSRWR